jgi:ribosomal protein S18 acetylase RimI-like enzyme
VRGRVSHNLSFASIGSAPIISAVNLQADAPVLVKIREATVDDARRICELNEAVQSVHATALPTQFKPYSEFSFPESLVTQLLSQPSVIMYVAQLGESSVGYLYAEVMQRPETSVRPSSNSLYIHHMAVESGSQRRGVGKLLLAAARQFAREKGVAAVTLDFWSFNEAARKFYLSQGFSPQREVVTCVV